MAFVENGDRFGVGGLGGGLGCGGGRGVDCGGHLDTDRHPQYGVLPGYRAFYVVDAW